MIAVLIVAHGAFAESLLQEAEWIAGRQKHVRALGLGHMETPGRFGARLRQTFDDLRGAEGTSVADGVLVLADVRGGTPYQCATRILGPRDAIVAGVNLPMLLEALLGRQDAVSAEQLAHRVAGAAKASIEVD